MKKFLESIKNIKKKYFNSLVTFCSIIIFIYVFIAIFYDLFPVIKYNLPSDDILQAPSKKHLLGTDDLGMDIFSQLLYGTRISLVVGVSCGIFASIGGSILGILGGYKGKRIDKILLSSIDVINSLPQLPFMIVLGAVLGPSIKNIIFAICLISWTMPARLIRSKVVKIKNQDYIKLAEKYGGGFFYILYKHLFVEIYPIMIVTFIRIINRAIVAEAGLAFLGLSDPLSKSWGMVLNRAIEFENIFLTDYWKWWLISPILFLVVFVLSISTIAREIEKRSLL